MIVSPWLDLDILSYFSMVYLYFYVDFNDLNIRWIININRLIHSGRGKCERIETS